MATVSHDLAVSSIVIWGGLRKESVNEWENESQVL